MNMRWLDRKPLADLTERHAVAVDAQRCAEVKVVSLVGLVAAEKAPQRAKYLGLGEVISHRAHNDSNQRLATLREPHRQLLSRVRCIAWFGGFLCDTFRPRWQPMR